MPHSRSCTRHPVQWQRRQRALCQGARLTHGCSASLRRVIAAFSSAPAGPTTAEGHGGLDKTGADSGDPRRRGSRYSGRAPRGAAIGRVRTVTVPKRNSKLTNVNRDNKGYGR